MGDITQNSEWYERMGYDETKRFLDVHTRQMSSSFVAIGFGLKRVRDNEMYLGDGYKNIWEFAKDRYNLSRSTAKRWMEMNDKYSQDGNSPVLADRYKNFGKSQLQEMLYLTDEQAAEVTEDMTVKEIRELRKPAEEEVEQKPDDALSEEKEELSKPDKTAREYLDAAARHLIHVYYDWMREDFSRRVTDVATSPGELKEKLEGQSRCHWFALEKKVERGLLPVAHINLFDEYVQIWDENSRRIGDYDWFYLAAAIQSQWNVVSLEKAQKMEEKPECATSHTEPDVIDGEYRECFENAADEPRFTATFVRDILWDKERELRQMEECNAQPDGELPERMMQEHRAVVAGLRLLLERLEMEERAEDDGEEM